MKTKIEICDGVCFVDINLTFIIIAQIMIQVLINSCYGGFSLYRWRFESSPWKGACFKSVTGNLVEVSTAVRFEIFNGVKDEAVVEFNRRNKELHPDALYINDVVNEIENTFRTNTILIDVIKDLGEYANGSCTSITIVNIPAKYEKFYRVGEYNGFEHITIEYEKYTLHTIKTILQNSQENAEKKISSIESIITIYNNEEPSISKPIYS